MLHLMRGTGAWVSWESHMVQAIQGGTYGTNRLARIHPALHPHRRRGRRHRDVARHDPRAAGRQGRARDRGQLRRAGGARLLRQAEIPRAQARLRGAGRLPDDAHAGAGPGGRRRARRDPRHPPRHGRRALHHRRRVGSQPEQQARAGKPVHGAQVRPELGQLPVLLLAVRAARIRRQVHRVRSDRRGPRRGAEADDRRRDRAYRHRGRRRGGSPKRSPTSCLARKPRRKCSRSWSGSGPSAKRRRRRKSKRLPTRTFPPDRSALAACGRPACGRCSRCGCGRCPSRSAGRGR